ncbi:AraC-like DNA-binding protein [Paenibacillus castaneae]|uniref:helix-turn-helix domain-containing protein n=1 Tax=Paenibacillus castaneae TaxID=474957 RepID=UPI000C9B74F6|nr:AraC family transcriptional regulator [Paenibacillus castaneae]NIK79478.1 AraC-like DNA-binding protein [Paenibacillus castaneae]
MPHQPNQIHRMELSYTGTEEVKLAGGQQLQLLNRYEYCFAFVLQQKVKVTIEEDEVSAANTADSDELFLIPPECMCTLYNADIQQAEVVLIRFRYETRASGKKAEAAKQSLPYKDAAGIKLFRMPQARSWVKDFQSDNSSHDIGMYYQLQSQLYAMAAVLLTVMQQPRETEAGLIGCIEWIKQYMIEEFNSPMDMEELARSSGMSASRFYQAFRSYIGISPLKYLTKLRLDASMRLLSGTPSSIVEIAHSVGYPDEYYFSRLFKKQMGLAPTEYAQLARKRVATLVSVFAGDLSAIGMTPCLSFRKVNGLEQKKVIQQLREAEPELILAGPLDEDMYAACSSIAPVLVLNWKGFSWKERLIAISEAVGLSMVAQRWLSYYESKVQNARIQLTSSLSDKPILLVHAGSSVFRMFGPRCRKMNDFFYDDLQMQPPHSVQQIGIFQTNSLRDIAEFGCGSVLFLVPSGTSRAYCEELEESWSSMLQTDEQRTCLFIFYNGRLNYNPTVHEGLIDETVRQVVSCKK